MTGGINGNVNVGLSYYGSPTYVIIMHPYEPPGCAGTVSTSAHRRGRDGSGYPASRPCGQFVGGGHNITAERWREMRKGAARSMSGQPDGDAFGDATPTRRAGNSPPAQRSSNPRRTKEPGRPNKEKEDNRISDGTPSTKVRLRE